MKQRKIGARAGVAEAGWTPEQEEAPRFRLLLDRALKPASPEALQRFMGRALGMLRGLEDAWPFREAVDPREVPDYYEIIKARSARLIRLLSCNCPPRTASCVMITPHFRARHRRQASPCPCCPKAATLHVADDTYWGTALCVGQFRPHACP
jgi:hypothetical protein